MISKPSPVGVSSRAKRGISQRVLEKAPTKSLRGISHDVRNDRDGRLAAQDSPIVDKKKQHLTNP